MQDETHPSVTKWGGSFTPANPAYDQGLFRFGVMYCWQQGTPPILLICKRLPIFPIPAGGISPLKLVNLLAWTGFLPIITVYEMARLPVSMILENLDA